MYHEQMQKQRNNNAGVIKGSQRAIRLFVLSQSQP